MTARDIVMSAAGNSGDSKTYVEDVFSTYLYTGNGSSQTINNGIALGDAVDVPIGTQICGGYFAGKIKQGGSTYAVIVSPKANGETSYIQWKTSGSSGPSEALTLNNGPAASAAMNSSTYPAASFCENLTINGYSDWYLPSRDELELCYRNLKPTAISSYVGTRLKMDTVYPEGNDVTGDGHGVNRNSDPSGSAYSIGSPAKTSAALFQEGGSEAFSAAIYWSSSDLVYAGFTQYAWYQSFENGNQGGTTKSQYFYTRAIRRVAISDPVFDQYRTAGKGGMVWAKSRTNAYSNLVTDTVRGINKQLVTNNTNAEVAFGDITSFNSNGYSLGYVNGFENSPGQNYASWTFRKAPKFFDVVTYTGNGATTKSVAHALGTTPGMILVKRTDSSGDWFVYHRSASTSSSWEASYSLRLNATNAGGNSFSAFGDGYDVIPPTSSTFTVGNTHLNTNGATYVAYLFAHDTTTDGLIQCGSFSGATTVDVNLGWEPQYVLFKNASEGGSWYTVDVMRGMSNTRSIIFQPNTSDAELDIGAAGVIPTATGFTFKGSNFGYTSGQNIIYMAIRRGPMKTPTDATKVFSPVAYSGTGGANVTQTTGFPVDFTFNLPRNNNYEKNVFDRLRGWPNGLYTNLTAAEFNNTSYLAFDSNTGVYAKLGSAYPNVTNGSGWTYVTEAFQRAPGFFDVVCYTGTGTKQTINHNLGVTPELIICKDRSRTSNWLVYDASVGNPTGVGYPFLVLNRTDPRQGDYSPSWVAFGNQKPDSTAFYVNDNYNSMNNAGVNSVAYLFASCPGVSKVGTYTGNGSSQTINCGFTNGARFVMVKRTDSTGDWWVFDTARGITSGNDPALRLNDTGAELTGFDFLAPNSSGFTIYDGSFNLNTTGATYIYLAIA